MVELSDWSSGIPAGFSLQEYVRLHPHHFHGALLPRQRGYSCYPSKVRSGSWDTDKNEKMGLLSIIYYFPYQFLNHINICILVVMYFRYSSFIYFHYTNLFSYFEFIKITLARARDIAQLHKCLPGKHEVVSWIPGTKIEKKKKE